MRLAALLAALWIPLASAQEADAVWLGGNLHTLDPRRPRAEALAVAGERIVAVGSNAEVLAHAGPSTRRFDLAGRTVVPGLIDAHGHLASLGSLETGRLDLGSTRSYDELLGTIAGRVREARPCEWIVGARWDQANWGEKDFPTHDRLSAVSPDNPVWLTRVDGHSGLANRRAMELAGIGPDTADPPGGRIARDAAGAPTGLFVDNAMDLVRAHVAAGRGATLADLLRAAQTKCLSLGLVGVHDAGVSPGQIEVYREMESRGELVLRIHAMVSGDAGIDWMEAHEPRSGDRLSVRAVKCMIDGAMGSRGAWLLAPYHDFPVDEAGKPYAGLPVTDPAEILAIARVAARRGYQVATHAIGDRGNREVLDAYEAALAAAPRADHRFRIEHAQLVAPEDVPRFAALGVIPSMQPTHATSDMRWAADRVGEERLAGAYAWAKFLRAGCRLAAGSDFPIESANPLWGFYAAVTRTDHEGRPEGGWRAEDLLTREEALRAFTAGAAYASFQEDRLGSLEPGKLADFVVLSRDVLVCPAAEILSTECLVTVVGGRVAYEK